MIETPVSLESLDWACRRIEDFYTVHKNGERPEMVDAVTILRTSLGVDDGLMDHFEEWAREWFGEDQSMGPIALGFMIGLIAADIENGS